MTNKHSSDREYALTLLLSCIDLLAGDLAVKVDYDPQGLIVKAMLKSALAIQYQGIERVSSTLQSDYAWLFDQVENLLY